MAERAEARPCPHCGTLTTCSGKRVEHLTGVCPACKAEMTIFNPDAPLEPDAPIAVATVPAAATTEDGRPIKTAGPDPDLKTPKW